MTDRRRRIPGTDTLLSDPAVQPAVARLGQSLVKQLISRSQQRARAGELDPTRVRDEVLSRLAATPTAASLTPVLNATGVVIHTNLGRAPLSAAATEAIVAAAGSVDVELDLDTGRRGRRGAAVTQALIDATGAEDAMVVNNGAAAVMLAMLALAGGRDGGEPNTALISRGELVEIGDGFRIPELIESVGVRLREVGTTNRTHLADYRFGLGPEVGCILKVHPSNFRLDGFVTSVGVAELTDLGIPVVYDLGSGLLRPDPGLPDEPDAATVLAAGAALVTCSGDKLLGGPQAGILAGKADLIQRLRRHPLARALRPDKLTLAGLEATLRGPLPPVTEQRRRTPDDLLARTQSLAQAVGGRVVESVGRIGGGGAPGVDLPGWAVELAATGGPADRIARRLRTGAVPVLARIDSQRCLVDLRCISKSDDDRLRAAINAALSAAPGSTESVPPCT